MIYIRPLELRDIHEVTELIKGNWADEQVVKTAVDQMYEAKCSNGNTDSKAATVKVIQPDMLRIYEPPA